MSTNLQAWWNVEDEGRVYTVLRDYVSTVERNQFSLFQKFVRLEAMYDPNAADYRSSAASPLNGGSQLSNVIENVIASNIDTVTAVVAASDVRARFMTDDADWSVQRRAKHLEWYSDGLSTTYDVDEKCRLAFRDAALKGTGLLKVYADADDEIHVDLVMVDDIVVDEAETRGGKCQPKQMHQRVMWDREELKALFPDHEEEIDRAGMDRINRLWAGYRPILNNELVAIESWRLPLGKRGKKSYKPGRHVITIEGCDLLDEEWHEQGFPFVRIVWSERNGWYGIGLAERIAGIQNALNKRNWQIDRLLNQGAAPTTYVGIMDASLTVKTETTGRASVVPHKGPTPVTVTPPIVNPETYQSRAELKNSAFEESGVSRMTAQAAKPAGIDSGVAMREYRDQTTQRFALQEKAFEQLKLSVILAIIGVCKKLGEDAPSVMGRTRWGRKKMEWSKVDMGEIKVQIAAASELPRTPAGRTQTVIEWAQAGIISPDSAKRLMDHPDLEREMSIITAGLESIERCLERIKDGEIVVPEPYMNLDLCVARSQMEYLNISGPEEDGGAPEEILEALRQFISQAAFKVAPPPANQNMPAMDANGNPMPVDPSMGMAPPAGPSGPVPGMPMPVGPVPQAALAAQAMQLRSA